MADTSIRTDKEKEAVNMNVIEERILLKTIQTLDLEKSYSVKLLNLEKKQVKFGQKRMRTKVKKIKTNLEPEDIAEMKTMELEGRFKPEYTPMNASGLIRILAATKRLKLMTNEELAEIVGKDLKRPLTTETTTVTPISRPVTPASGLRGRSQSVPRELNLSGSSSFTSHYETKKFPVVQRTKTVTYDSTDDLRSASRVGSARPQSRISVDSDEFDIRLRRPMSQTGYRSAQPSKLPCKDDVDGPCNDGDTVVLNSANLKAHALTTKGFFAARPNTVNAASHGKPPKAPRPKTALGIPNRGLSFSSHKKKSTEDKCRRESILSTSSIGSEIAREKAAEFRKELLTDEEINTTAIQERQHTFLSRMSAWLEGNNISDNSRRPGLTRRATTMSMLDPSRATSPTKLVEEDIEEKKEREWADIKKCRYLRGSDDVADLSGVTTLVRDQLNQLRVFQPGAPKTTRVD